jgi:hypothetical protein
MRIRDGNPPAHEEKTGGDFVRRLHEVRTSLSHGRAYGRGRLGGDRKYPQTH